MKRIPLPVALALAATVLTAGLPVAALFLQSVFPGLARGRFDEAFSPYLGLASMDGIGRMWSNSLACAVATTVVSWALGLPAGWLLARARLPGKALLRLTLLLPAMSPPYLLALAYVLLFQTNGLVDHFVGRVPDGVRDAFFSIAGVVFVMALAGFGTVALMVEAALRGISSRLEEAASCLGAPPAGVFRRVTLPLLLPAIVGSGVLVFVDALSNFGIAAILGPRSNLLLLPAIIYELLTTWPVDIPAAAAISSLLAFTSMALVSAARFLAATRALASSRVAVARLVSIGAGWRTAAIAFFGALFLFSFALPNAAIFLMSIVDRWMDGSPTFTARHFLAVLEFGGSGMQALSTSAGLSAGAATACAFLGALSAYALARYRGRAVAALDQLAMLPRVVPNLVIAVGLILAWNARWAPIRVYGTLAILFLAYVAIYQAVALRFADAAMQQLAPRLEQAAACLGASRLSTLRRIVLPLLAPSLLMAWISIFVMCLRDWVASILLLPPGAQTVGSFIFSQFEQGDFSQAMAMAICAVVLSTIPLAIVNLRLGERSAA